MQTEKKQTPIFYEFQHNNQPLKFQNIPFYSSCSHIKASRAAQGRVTDAVCYINLRV